MEPGLLVASPQMKDPWFEGAVVLLCQHDDEQAFGLVINRAGEAQVADVLERLDLELAEGGDAPTLWGGPVRGEAGFVVFEGTTLEDEGWSLEGKVGVSPSIERLALLVGDNRPFLLCLGYAGWGPAQLDLEVEKGSWIHTDLDPEIVLRVPLAERYERALASLGLTPHSVWMNPVNE